MRRVNLRLILTAVALATAGAATLPNATVEAHKAVTSQYSYNEHVFPILRDHCGACHVAGGVAPMSLLEYRNDTTGGAFAWAQAIKEMLVSEAMPPWYADPTGPAVRHGSALTSREMDIVVTWASGGAPEGDPAKQSAAPTRVPRWTLGQPDLVLQMPSPHQVPAEMTSERFETTIPTNARATQWVKAADLLPGTPSMVRRAEISVVDGPVLRVWEPGDEVAAAPEGSAFELPASAQLRLKIFYKKSWQEEKDAKSDRSTIGLYFGKVPASGHGIAAVRVGGPSGGDAASVSFSGPMTMRGRVLAIRPSLDRAYNTLEVTAVDPSARRVPLLKLHAARPEWPRRYWLEKPVAIPEGSRIEVTGTAAPPNTSAAPADPSPLEVSVDFDPQ
jgi:hypothetical protein